MTIEEISFNIILHAGDSKSLAMEAIQDAKKYCFSDAMEKLAKANEAFAEAHHFQLELIQKEAEGEKNDISVLLIHSQDHIMGATLFCDMANETIELYEKFKKLEDKIEGGK